MLWMQLMSYAMLFGKPWLKDTKVSHDWGTNFIIIESIGIVITIIVIDKLNKTIRKPKMLLYYTWFHQWSYWWGGKHFVFCKTIFVLCWNNKHALRFYTWFFSFGYYWTQRIVSTYLRIHFRKCNFKEN